MVVNTMIPNMCRAECNNDIIHGKSRHDNTRMINETESVSLPHAKKLVEAASNAIEDVAVLSEGAKRSVQLQRAVAKQSTAAY